MQNYQHNYWFVPRTHPSGQGVSMLISADSRIVAKYVYVSDREVTGNDKNSQSDFATSGLTLDNRRQVLTEVLGV